MRTGGYRTTLVPPRHPEGHPSNEEHATMTRFTFMPRAVRIPIAGLVTALLLATTTPADAHAIRDETPRTAVVSAFAPELAILQGELEGASSQSVNGVAFTTGTLEGRDVVLFLSGISVVNAAMTVQLALDHFAIDRIVFSGIAGGVDPGLNIGDVVIADRWGQYLEMLFAREVDGGWMTMPFFEYPYANFGMMFPRSVTVLSPGAEAPETRFWFPVDDALARQRRQRGKRRDARPLHGGGQVPREAFRRSLSAARASRAAPSSTTRPSAPGPSRPSARGCWIWKAPPWPTWPTPTTCPSSPSAASRISPAAAKVRTRWRSSWASRRAMRRRWSRRCSGRCRARTDRAGACAPLPRSGDERDEHHDAEGEDGEPDRRRRAVAVL